MQKRSFFEIIFGKPTAQPQQDSHFTQLKMMNGYVPIFSQFSTEAYDNDVVRAAVDAIARNGAKLKPKHIRRIENQIKAQDSNEQYLLAQQPNPFMDSYTFLYKVITTLYLQNNSFIYVDRDAFKIKGFYPINPSNVELLEAYGTVYAKFSFMGGQNVTLPYTELIHLRKFFYKDDFYGESNSSALNPALQLITTVDEGIVNGLQGSAHLRGILKTTQSLRPEDLKKQKDAFLADYMSVSNNGGVVATDAKMEYIPLDNKPTFIDDKQMALVEDKVYKYFGVSKEIITSSYNEDQWNAFYSSVIEPLAIQMSQQFTNRIFSDRKHGFGSEIIFSANRLTYASNQTKVNMARDLLPLGMFTINEMREIFELEPVEGGDKRIQTLNVVDADKANQYQGVGGDGNDNQGQGV